MWNHGMARSACAIGVLVASGTASGQWEVIFHDIAGVTGSSVPGVPGANFDSFDRPFISPDGSWWALTASTDLATSEDEVLLTGQESDGAVFVREGTPLGFNASENNGLLDTRVAIDNSGSFVYTTNSNGPTTGDEYVIHFDAGAGTFSAAAQEGAAIPSMPGSSYGSTLDTPVLTSSGPGFVGAASGSTAEIVFLNGGAVATEDVTVPSGQAGGAMESWESFDLNDFYASADGSSWLAQGDLNGDTGVDDIVAVNNVVVIQEGSVFGGQLSPVATVNGVHMSASGDWTARVENADGGDFLVSNGSVIAQGGDAVLGGLPGESYSDADFGDLFFTVSSNNVGDIVFGAVTDADSSMNGVLVHSSFGVVAREGDAVDLDGNGLFDDGVFFNTFGNDDWVLTDDQTLYGVATLLDASGAGAGSAFVTLAIPAPASLLPLAGIALAGRRRRR